MIEEEPQLAEFNVSEALRDALVSLDGVNVETEFRRRANLMRSPPKFMEGAYVSAVRLAMEEVREGRRTNNEARRIRGWKLFLMIPRMLLVKPRKGSLMPKSKLRERFAQFAQGRWIALISASRDVSFAVAVAKSRRSRNLADTVERRAERARVLASMGELSSARLALEGEAVAPSDQATLGSSRDRRRRPPETPKHSIRGPGSQTGGTLLVGLRAAAGPSGMTNDHLFPLLRNPHDSVLLCVGTGVRPSGDPASNRGFSAVRMTALKKTIRWHPRQCGRRDFASSGGSNAGPKFGFRVQDRDGSSSARVDHTFRLRVDRPRAAGAHRSGPSNNRDVSREERSRVL